MRQSFNILVDGDNLLQILVLAVAEDGVVDNYTVHGRVIVRFDEAVLKKFAIDFAQVKCEAIFDTSFARPFCVYPRRRIRAGKEADEQRLAPNLAQTIAHFIQKTLGDVVRKDDFAVGFIVGHGGVTLLFWG
jgi:hypothetical protein